MNRLFCCVLGMCIGSFFQSLRAQNSIADHVVISEVQIAGGSAKDEFVELYNPTQASIDLAGWRLTAKTSSGSTTKNLVTTFPPVMIKPYSFLLIAPDEYDGPVLRDVAYSTSSTISSNNTIILYSDNGVTIVDMVGLGTATLKETTTVANPVVDGSIERKASAFSDAVSLSAGGSEEHAGNGQDTDNNAEDFVQQPVSRPQNSSNQPENDQPIPVELVSFSARYEGGGVRLQWSTATETENYGFHVFRKDDRDSDFRRISGQIIPGAGNSSRMRTYGFFDEDVVPGSRYMYRIADVDFQGNMTLHEPVTVVAEAVVPAAMTLEQNYPNPFAVAGGQGRASTTTIRFGLGKAGPVQLAVYSIDGRRIITLVDEEKSAGDYRVVWNGRDEAGHAVSAGIYLYVLKLSGFQVSQKMLIIE